MSPLPFPFREKGHNQVNNIIRQLIFDGLWKEHPYFEPAALNRLDGFSKI